MKIAVTACSGQLGSAIVKQLVRQLNAENVIGIARTPNKALSRGIEIRQGDYNYQEQFEKAFQGIDNVLLVSGMDAPEKRIEQHRNIINAARGANVKKIVYTSIIGEATGTTFSPIVAANRQTEEDIKSSGLNWSIGRNGLYIEPDIEYLEHYTKVGKIANCADDGKCAYTTRNELGFAYTQMLLDDKHNGRTYNLVGEAITQQKLAELLNHAFGTTLQFEPLSVEEYQKDRVAELGDFLGTIIAGIYAGIRQGCFNVKSDYHQAAGREHITWQDYFDTLSNI
jgi:NAD(P)H dehydrogenase (quinone)